ncbi:MAG: hypothetical protein ACE5HX_00785 [bacterium]
MADKRQELKSLIKGKGLNALKASQPLEEKVIVKDPAKEEKDLVVSTKETKEEKVKKEKKEVAAKLESKPDILEIKPSPEEIEVIQNLSGGAAEYVLIWRAFTSSNDEKMTVFNKGEMVTFNIDCVVAKIIAQLKAPFTLEVHSFDVRSHHSQALYSFKKEDQIQSEVFRVQFQIEAVLSGIFKLQTLFIIHNTEHFHVNEESYFRIM